MSIRIGVYDFFAYTIPGGFYLANILYFVIVFNIVNANFQTINDISFTTGIIIAIVAYVAGVIINPITKRWHRLLKAKNLAGVALEELKEKRNYSHIAFQAQDWPVLLAYVRQGNSESTAAIEQNNSIHIMLRGVSLSLAIFAIIQVFEFVFVRQQIVLIVSIIILLALSLLASQESKKFSRWFYLSIYEAAIASNLDVLDLFPNRKVASSEDSKKPLVKQ